MESKHHHLDIRVTGDCWNNREDIEQYVSTLPYLDTITLDLHAEGPSLYRIGLVDFFLKNRHPGRVLITRWSNSREQIPFPKEMCNNLSHFWKYSRNYWDNVLPVENPAKYLFGLFLGRKTIARNCILYDCVNTWPNDFLFSQMKNTTADQWRQRVNDLESLPLWCNWDRDKQQEIIQWVEQDTILSLDNKTVRDQYTVLEQSSIECNRSLLSYYNQFQIELVCETYTLGDTFFPTEKTVRPLVASKPMLIYGPKGFLEQLRNLGFKTYSECWNEDYDIFEGPDRWARIKQTIEQIKQTIDSNMIQHAQSIAEYNRNFLPELIRQV